MILKKIDGERKSGKSSSCRLIPSQQMKASKSHLLILLVVVLLTACDSGGGSGEQIKSEVKDGISGLVSDIK
jgi:hypothetical protein